MSKVFATLRFKVDEQPYVLELRDDELLGLTPREHGVVRRHAAVTGTVGLADAIQNLDGEVLGVLAFVAAKRRGVDLDVDAILDGKATLSVEIDVPESGPPPAAAEESAA